MAMDLDQITDLIGNSGDAIESATGAARSIRNLLMGDKAPDPSEARLQLIELLGKLIEAKEGHVKLQDEILKLRRELDAREDFETRKQRYTMFQTPGDAVVWKFAAQNPGEIDHFACVNCMEEKRISVLPPNTTFAKCHHCAAEFRLKPYSSTPTIDMGSRRDRY